MHSHYCLIEQLPGLSQEELNLLKDFGITNTKQLLQKVTSSSPQKLANQLRINLKSVRKWVALADLSRLPSIGYSYCGLLLHSGIISVVQLRETNAARLHQQILRLQVATMQRKDLCPPITLVKQWIYEARIIN